MEIKSNGDYDKLLDMESQGVDINSPEFKEGMKHAGKDPVTDFGFAKLYSIGVK